MPRYSALNNDRSRKGGYREDMMTPFSGWTRTLLAAMVAAEPRLRLRGLMAIPAPAPDPGQRRAAFGRMRALFDALRADHPQVDTLSMGMSDDFELAIAEGATMVRVGTALFGRRERGPG